MNTAAAAPAPATSGVRALADARLDHDVDRTTGHDQMLDAIATNQQQAAAAVDTGLLDHGQAPLRALPEKATPGDWPFK